MPKHFAERIVPHSGSALWFGTSLALAMSAPLPASAQAARWYVDLNGSRIQYDSVEALNAPSLATTLEWQGTKIFSRISASLTGFQNNGWSAQGRGDLVGWLSPLGAGNPVIFEVSAGLAGSRHSSGFDSYLGRADARLHVVGRYLGVWAGAGAASARNAFDTAAVTSVRPAAGIWARSGPARAALSYLQNTMDGESHREGNLTLTYSQGAFDLTALAGLRQSPFEGVEDDSWAGISAAIWLNSQLGLLLSGGQYAPDILQGLPGSQYFSLGVRLTPRRNRPLSPSITVPLVYSRASARSGGIGFHLDRALRVEIAGDWNGWQPIPLSQDTSGRWIVPPGIPPGAYRFNLRVDGGKWMVPEGVPEADDGFGGRVGLLIISES